VSRSQRSDDDRIAASPVALAEIPMIDFAPFLDGDAADRRAVADRIVRACEDIGFFYLRGHGVAPGTVDAVFTHARRFFALPADQRAEAGATPAWYRGWIPAAAPQPLSRNTRMFEQYRLQPEWPADSDDTGHAAIFDLPNRWPAGVPGFRQASEAYLEAMLALSHALLHAFALGLGLAERHFDAFFQHPPSQLSLNYYPVLPSATQDDASNMVAHTDEGPFTILAQDAQGGLEVKRRDGVWIQAPPIAGAFTINIGDMMMWWSNGRLLSNLHRVRNRGEVERFSIPYFANPDRAVTVSPLPEIVGDGEALYPPVRVADHLARFYATLSMDPHDIYR
jgi:isopenicillin N synthase-like dioxygenase